MNIFIQNSRWHEQYILSSTPNMAFSSNVHQQKRGNNIQILPKGFMSSGGTRYQSPKRKVYESSCFREVLQHRFVKFTQAKGCNTGLHVLCLLDEPGWSLKKNTAFFLTAKNGRIPPVKMDRFSLKFGLTTVKLMKQHRPKHRNYIACLCHLLRNYNQYKLDSIGFTFCNHFQYTKWIAQKTF